jgi:hypothetical protein
MTQPSRAEAEASADADDATVIRLSRREPEQFTVLFRRHAPHIQRYVMRRLGQDAADDIVAETFLLAFRQRDSYDQTRADARPWLYGIATNLIGRHCRAETKMYRAPARTGADPVMEPFTDRVDDSEQAAYVNGTLQVCQRTDPCAASEQWLMPVGPSYTLIYPQYPRPTKAETQQALNDLKHHKLPRPLKASKPVKQLPTLPAYPRPLLDKLNAYSTGCADVAGDCNVVNVAANVLTGYGNYPYLDASWFLALADVPGVSLQHVTDAAGRQDIAFTFPSQDGVTAILVNASLLNKGEIQYEGYVRNGQQTLVVNQALVSGPGVRP